jgi:hypothetical protein
LAISERLRRSRGAAAQKPREVAGFGALNDVFGLHLILRLLRNRQRWFALLNSASQLVDHTL